MRDRSRAVVTRAYLDVLAGDFGHLVHVAESGWPRDAPMVRGHAVTVQIPPRGACKWLRPGSRLEVIAERDRDSL
eukprot:COSAG01_NODE_28988_length_648_cov_0.468124_2_plen_74_part_01